MKIKKMTATFGRLNQAVLCPGDTLTVFSAPNEAGKSTWAGFLKAMLYGIDTRERDKTGFLADKSRYQPWSGAPMAGELQIEWQGQDITIRRFASRGHPFGGFEAVYTVSGDPVPGLTAAGVGQLLTGVGKDVFVRTALVGQNAAAVTAVPELEQRIAALATSAQEDVSFSSTERRLKDWRNLRRANRANGLIPELEGELTCTRQALRDMEEARRRHLEAEEHLARLEKEKSALTAEMERHRQLAQQELNRRYSQALAEWQRAQAGLSAPAIHPLFHNMSGEEAWSFAQKKQREREAAERENRRRQEARAAAEQTMASGSVKLLLGGLFAAGLLLSLILFGFLSRSWPMGGLCALFALACAGCLLRGGGQRRAARAALRELAPLEVPDHGDLLALAADYREALAQARQSQAVADAARQRLEELEAQGGRPLDALDDPPSPLRSAPETAARLAAVEAETLRWHSQRDQAIGALRDDPLALEARAGQIAAQLSRRTMEYDALDMALTALELANNTLRQRFSPALNQAAGEMFAQLTGQRYRQLSLDRDFSAQLTPSEEAFPRSLLYLSAGTVEQLYLAVRLAMCRLTLPDTPILLDDTLACFDDERMALAMDCLQALSRERQILLFSCHGREARWAEAHGIPTLKL